MVVTEHLGLAVLGATQDRLTPADRNTTVDGTEPYGVDPGGPQRGDETLVHFATVGHQHGVHGRRVGVAGDTSTRRGDHARWHAEPGAEVAELGVPPMNHHDRFGDSSEILSEVGVAALADGRAAADLDHEHRSP